MKALIFLTVISLCLMSCFKRDESNVNAVCRDSCMTFHIQVSTGLNSATPISKAYVELGWSYPATPIGNPGRLIAKGYTSANGIIHFSFKAKSIELDRGRFYVSARKYDNYFNQYDTYYGISKFDSVVNTSVHLPSKATLKIVYKNFNPTNSEDFFQCAPTFLTYGSTGYPIKMSKPDGKPSNTHFFPNDGSFAKIELTGTTAGNQYTHFNIIKKKNGVRVNLRDSIFIERGQTKVYEVEY